MSEKAEQVWPYFGVPPPRQPRPAAEEPSLPGKRVVLSTPEGFIYDMRAVSRVYRDKSGRQLVDIVSDEDYFRWMLIQHSPVATPYSVTLVWVE